MATAVTRPPSWIVAHFFSGISPWRPRRRTAVEKPSITAGTRRRLFPDDNRAMRGADPSRRADSRRRLKALLGFAHRNRRPSLKRTILTVILACAVAAIAALLLAVDGPVSPEVRKTAAELRDK